MGCGFNYMYETCWCMQAKNECESVCAAAGCMWTCPAEECMTCLCSLLSGLIKATSFVNVARMPNCITLEWSNM